MNQDPVCGMTVESTNTALQSQHKGETYYFCSAQCKQQFDREPDRFARLHTSAQEGGRAVGQGTHTTRKESAAGTQQGNANQPSAGRQKRRRSA